MTFSIVAYDPKTKEYGVAAASKTLAVGSRVPYAKADAGAVASQGLSNPIYGIHGIPLLYGGFTSEQVLKSTLQDDIDREKRQVAIIDSYGNSNVFTGKETIPWSGHYIGDYYSVQGNILTGPNVLTDMKNAYEQSRRVPNSELAIWLMNALMAGEQAGGDRRGKQSAAILVVKEEGGPLGKSDRYIDLRVDDHSEPVQTLYNLVLKQLSQAK